MWGSVSVVFAMVAMFVPSAEARPSAVVAMEAPLAVLPNLRDQADIRREWVEYRTS